MTEARQSGTDVRSLTDALLAHAAAIGGQLTSARSPRRSKSADVSPDQAKKLLRSLSEAGITVVVDGSASTVGRKVAAARSATAAAKVTTAKAPVQAHRPSRVQRRRPRTVQRRTVRPPTAQAR